MKSVAYHRTERIPFPNALTRKQALDRLLDLLVMGAAGAGMAASLMLLLVLV